MSCHITSDRLITNRFLKYSGIVYSVDQKVEWHYSFDVFCNGFFPAFLILGIVQFFLFPLLLRESFFSVLLSSTLYTAAAMYFFYITFLGFKGLICFADHVILTNLNNSVTISSKHFCVLVSVSACTHWVYHLSCHGVEFIRRGGELFVLLNDFEHFAKPKNE